MLMEVLIRVQSLSALLYLCLICNHYAVLIVFLFKYLLEIIILFRFKDRFVL